ncbi:hypothetical protein FOA52_013337 [Chlamydomonas sp. UWO 241]|nr:hypothetical protein FOA52_013337 [Chlamydomonas sp. UWO 241]
MFGKKKYRRAFFQASSITGTAGPRPPPNGEQLSGGGGGAGACEVATAAVAASGGGGAGGGVGAAFAPAAGPPSAAGGPSCTHSPLSASSARPLTPLVPIAESLGGRGSQDGAGAPAPPEPARPHTATAAGSTPWEALPPVRGAPSSPARSCPLPSPPRPHALHRVATKRAAAAASAAPSAPAAPPAPAPAPARTPAPTYVSTAADVIAEAAAAAAAIAASCLVRLSSLGASPSRGASPTSSSPLPAARASPRKMSAPAYSPAQQQQYALHTRALAGGDSPRRSDPSGLQQPVEYTSAPRAGIYAVHKIAHNTPAPGLERGFSTIAEESAPLTDPVGTAAASAAKSASAPGAAATAAAAASPEGGMARLLSVAFASHTSNAVTLYPMSSAGGASTFDATLASNTDAYASTFDPNHASIYASTADIEAALMGHGARRGTATSSLDLERALSASGVRGRPPPTIAAWPPHDGSTAAHAPAAPEAPGAIFGGTGTAAGAGARGIEGDVVLGATGHSMPGDWAPARRHAAGLAYDAAQAAAAAAGALRAASIHAGGGYAGGDEGSGSGAGRRAAAAAPRPTYDGRLGMTVGEARVRVRAPPRACSSAANLGYKLGWTPPAITPAMPLHPQQHQHELQQLTRASSDAQWQMSSGGDGGGVLHRVESASPSGARGPLGRAVRGGSGSGPGVGPPPVTASTSTRLLQQQFTNAAPQLVAAYARASTGLQVARRGGGTTDDDDEAEEVRSTAESTLLYLHNLCRSNTSFYRSRTGTLNAHEAVPHAGAGGAAGGGGAAGVGGALLQQQQANHAPLGGSGGGGVVGGDASVRRGILGSSDGPVGGQLHKHHQQKQQ